MIRYEQQLYYFQFWPPQGECENFPTNHKFNKKQVQAHPWLGSPYFHWWRYLRASKIYRETCKSAKRGGVSSEIYQDFGDVHASDDFWPWWLERGCDLFCEPRSYSIVTHESVNWPSLDDYAHSDKQILVTISLEGDIERTISEVKELLKQRSHKDAGRGRNTSGALYQIFTKPDVAALDRYYRVWEVHERQPWLSNAEIAWQCGLVPQKPTDRYDEIMASNDVTRMLAKANAIIKYVHQGVFPVMDDGKGATIPSFLVKQRTNSQVRRDELASGNYPSYFDISVPICVAKDR